MPAPSYAFDKTREISWVAGPGVPQSGELGEALLLNMGAGSYFFNTFLDPRGREAAGIGAQNRQRSAAGLSFDAPEKGWDQEASAALTTLNKEYQDVSSAGALFSAQLTTPLSILAKRRREYNEKKWQIADAFALRNPDAGVKT